MQRHAVTGQITKLALILILACPPFSVQHLSAQENQEGVVIGDVQIEFIGVQNVNEEVVRSNIQVSPGVPYSEAMVDDSVRGLYNTNLFEYIDVKRLEVRENLIDLIFRVKAKYRVLAIFFDGNSRIKDKRLEKEIASKVNAALIERLVKEDTQTLYAYYQKKGFTQAQVDYEIDRDLETGFGEITFRINEGPKVRVSRIYFQGNTAFKNKKLVKEMETRPWNWISWLTGSGKLDDDEFEEDLIKVRDFYRNEGYLDVEILEDEIQFDYSRTGKLDLYIPVVEGRQYKIGDISISGNELFPSELLLAALELQKGSTYLPEKLDEDRESLTDFYGSVGYLDARVDIKRIPNIETGDIDIEYVVSEGERFRVESIKIEGNTKSKSVIILRELSLAPGMPFDLLRMKVSKQRLENTRWFETVETTDEPTNIPQRRNLKVTVEEGRTGNFTFGAGYSSIQRAVGFIEITQGNFDIFNWRSFFQGDGQKLRLRLEVGSLSDQAVLYWEEPYFLDNYFYQLGFGFQVFQQSSEYFSTLYDETRVGFEVFLRKRLIELIEVRLSYSLEDVTLDFFQQIPPGFLPYFNEEEVVADRNEIQSEISRMSLALVRDTRDKILFTNKGTRLMLINTVGGGLLGGTQDFVKVEFLGSTWIPIFELGQGLNIDVRTGVAFGYDDTQLTPFTEQFFLGGPNTIRGFDYRRVGPVDMGTPLTDATGEVFLDENGNPRLRFEPSFEPKGGQTYGMITLEYFYSISEQVRLAAFYDGGFVGRGVADYGKGIDWWSDNIGIGLTITVMGTPLRLDYAIPINSTDIRDQTEVPFTPTMREGNSTLILELASNSLLRHSTIMRRLCVITIFLAAQGFFIPVGWAELNIMTVDIGILYDNYYKTNEAEEKLKVRMETAKGQLDEMNVSLEAEIETYKTLLEEAQNPVLSDEAHRKAENEAHLQMEKIRQMQQDVRVFQQSTQNQLAKQQNTQRQFMLEEIKTVILEMANQKGADLVLDTTPAITVSLPSVLFANPTWDATKDVLAILNADAPIPAEVTPAD